MEGDQNPEMYRENAFSFGLKDSPAKNLNSDTAEDNSSSFNEDTIVSVNQEISPTNGPTLPILQKIVDLSNKIKELKEEHAVVSNQVKDIKNCSFPDPEMSKAIQLMNNELGILKKKYLEESLERKRLYNEVIELKGNIRVFCRCRPLNQAEISNGSTSVVEFDPSQDDELQVISSDSSKKHFKFDHVFKPDDGQEAVFAQTKPIVTSVLDGYNVCIFAYGQTGTGKTFTMEGTPEDRGVNYRTLEELFRCSESRSHLVKFELCVSMLEVYNEKIRDLLVENSNQPPKKLEVKQSAEGTQEVSGLVEARVYNTDEVWELLKAGYRVRSVGSTAANEQSSRSHCLLRVTVKGENVINGQRSRSHLWLVDLAGSERVGKIDVEGERLKESQFINKSLSALGDVISSLASKTSHIPYRNSKLTHMLQNSLGGNCKTLMFVQISPSSTDSGETLCSLNFASRVRGIESGPARKQADVSELLKYKQMAEKLKQDEKETKKLQDSVQSLQLRLAAREHICRGLQDKLRDLEAQLAEERKTRIKQETRAYAATSSSSKHHQTEKLPSIAEKKPPLAPGRTRMPLRKITNLGTHASPVPAKKQKASYRYSLGTFQNKENSFRPRRSSIAVRVPQQQQPSSISSGRTLQPRRRVSIATLRPEAPPQSHHVMTTMITTPLRQSSSSSFNNGFRGDARKARYSKLFSPMPDFRASSSSSDHLATPNNFTKRNNVGSNSSSKFMRSPPMNNNNNSGSAWKPSHPTVIALQKKAVVWSPLKMKAMKNRRPSFLPIRPSSSSAAADLLRREQ